MKLYKNILQHSGIYTISVVFSKLMSMLMLPLYTRYLTPADYGIMELLELVSYVFTVLIGIHFADAVFYFYSAAEDDEGRHRVVSTALLGSLLLGVPAAAACWLGAPWLSQLVFQTAEYGHYFRITFITAALIFPQEIGFAYLRIRAKSGTVVILQCARVLLTVVLNLVLLVRYSMGVNSVLISALVCTALAAGVLTCLIYSRTRPAFDAALFGSLFRYAAPVAVSGLGMLCLNFGDRFFLQRSVSLSEIGIYSLAYKLGMLVSYIQYPFSMYWDSQMFRIVREPGGERAYVRVCTYLVMALTGAALALSVFSRPLVTLLAAPSFRRAALFVPAVAAAYVVRGAADYFRYVFFLEKKPGTNAKITWAGVVVCLAAYGTLIPRYKLWGAIVATQLGFIAMAVGAFIFGQRVRSFHFEWRRLVVGAGAAVLCWAAIAQFADGRLWATLAWGCVGLSLWPGMLYVSGFFTPEERRVVSLAGRRIRQWAGAMDKSRAA